MPIFTEDSYTLDEDTVLSIHDIVLIAEGGLPGLAKDKSLVAALNRIDNYIFYDGLSNLYEIAALYGIALAQGHIFNDGNKRTAMVCILVFLRINGINCVPPDSEIPDILVSIAEKKMLQDEIARWLENYTIKK